MAKSKPSVPRTKHPLKVYALSYPKGDTGANYYYRVSLPLQVLQEMGLVRMVIEPVRAGATPEGMEKTLQEMGHQDLHLYYGRPTPNVMNRLMIMGRLKPMRGGQYGGIQYPPQMLFSFDDNYHYVSPFNHAFLWHGTKLWDGTEIQEGDKVEVMLAGGKKAVLWEDGKELVTGEKFSASDNRKRLQQMDEILGNGAGTSVTTERLAKYYRDFGYRNVNVFPNSIFFPHYKGLESCRQIRKDPKTVRVLWQGGDSHYPDWWEMKNVLPEISRRFPEVRWVIWGAAFKSIMDLIPDDRVEYLPWVHYESYKVLLTMLDFDFAIAPLCKSIFNEGKSCIKFYEPAVLPSPKPTLCANVPPYSDEMIDGSTGYLYSSPAEFIEKFGILVQDAKKRQELAEGAREWVRENRDVEQTVLPFYEWMRETRAAATQGPKHGLMDLLGEASGNSGRDGRAELPGVPRSVYGDASAKHDSLGATLAAASVIEEDRPDGGSKPGSGDL